LAAGGPRWLLFQVHGGAPPSFHGGTLAMFSTRRFRIHHLLVLLPFLLPAVSCGPGPETEEEAAPEEPELPPEPQRIVAIGDLHGDLEAARAALLLAHAIDRSDKWIGGDLQVVQVGDILDRGDGEKEILDLFHRLQDEAAAAGGGVHLIHGNHELMNAYMDFRYVTEGGFHSFEGLADVDPTDSVLGALEPDQRPRAAAFRPGGPMARRLAEHRLAVTLGGTIFTHAGILPVHTEMGLDSMEAKVHAWLMGEASQPEWIRGDSSPVWNRAYSGEPRVGACDSLAMVLDRLGLERMVVGHTVQAAGITAYCGGRLWCIDVGMARHYGGRPEILEIQGTRVKSLRWPFDL